MKTYNRFCPEYSLPQCLLKHGIVNNFEMAANAITMIIGDCMYFEMMKKHNSMHTFPFDKPFITIWWLYRHATIKYYLNTCDDVISLRENDIKWNSLIENNTCENYYWDDYHWIDSSLESRPNRWINLKWTLAFKYSFSPDLYFVYENKEYHGLDTLYELILSMLKNLYTKEISSLESKETLDTLNELRESNKIYIADIADIIRKRCIMQYKEKFFNDNFKENAGYKLFAESIMKPRTKIEYISPDLPDYYLDAHRIRKIMQDADNNTEVRKNIRKAFMPITKKLMNVGGTNIHDMNYAESMLTKLLTTVDNDTKRYKDIIENINSYISWDSLSSGIKTKGENDIDFIPQPMINYNLLKNIT